jgi:hypothetical protein
MVHITTKNGFEIWAQFDQTAQVYELFFDSEGESFTGWNADSIKDANYLAPRIIEQAMAE